MYPDMMGRIAKFACPCVLDDQKMSEDNRKSEYVHRPSSLKGVGSRLYISGQSDPADLASLLLG